MLHRNIWLPSSWDKSAQAELSAVVCSTQANQVKIRLGIVPLCCSPKMSPSPLDAFGCPSENALMEREFRHIPSDSLTARLASVRVRSVVKYIPTCDRCMENPFFNFWQKGIGMQLGKLQTHAHSANFCNNRKLVTVNSGK